RAEDAVRTVRCAIEEGVVPGGGAALLACADAVRRVEATGDQRVGLQILARALEEPMRRIIVNSGFEEAPILQQVRAAEPGHGFDVIAGRVTKMLEAGIYDPTRVVRFALETGVSGALMGVTTEALIL